MTDRFHRVFKTLWGHRRRMAPIVLGLAVLVVGTEVMGAMPHETDVELRLGADHAEVVEARVSYLLDGEEMHGSRFTWPGGAPERVRQAIDLPGGRYEVEIDLRTHDHTRTERRALEVPAEGR